MGYYIQTPNNNHKSAQLVELFDARAVDRPQSFSDVPDGMALICVVDNSSFEAAGYVCDEREFKEFTNPHDFRPKQFLLMEKALAEKLSGYVAANK